MLGIRATWRASIRFDAMTILFRLTTIAMAFVLCACGQKGPLYLPGDPSLIQTEVPQAESNSEEDDDEDEEAADPR